MFYPLSFKKDYTVYMLRCNDNSYYVGMTSDLPKRIWQHNHHFFKNCYTAKRLPIELVYTGVFEDVHDATAWERRIKKWSRKKKEALFIGDRDRLKSLAARHSTVNVVQDFKRKFRKMYASYCYAVSF